MRNMTASSTSLLKYDTAKLIQTITDPTKSIGPRPYKHLLKEQSTSSELDSEDSGVVPMETSSQQSPGHSTKAVGTARGTPGSQGGAALQRTSSPTDGSALRTASQSAPNIGAAFPNDGDSDESTGSSGFGSFEETAVGAGDLSVWPSMGTKLTWSESQTPNEILSIILPPRTWSDEAGNKWQQQVSSAPTTRQDVLALQEQLDNRLQQRQARETGICPVRRDLYSQCFDELIRQVTINCAERGLLLLRVRDEMNMTLTAYKTLYESSVAFGMRKALASEQGKSDMANTIQILEQQKDELQRRVQEMTAKCEQIEHRAVEQKKVEEAKHQEEIMFLKRSNQQLKAQLEGIIQGQDEKVRTS